MNNDATMTPRKRRLLLIAALHAGLIAIVTGAYISSVKAGSPASQTEPSSGVHRIVALLAAGLTGAGVIAEKFTASQRLAISIAAASLIVSAAIGWNPPLSQGAAVWHAAFAHLFVLSIVIALLVPVRQQKLDSWRALRPAAMWTPAAVFGQILMG